MSIRINDLTVRFKNGVVAVNKASLEIPKGIYGLLGENGAGTYYVRDHYGRNGKCQPPVQQRKSEADDRAAESEIRLGVFVPRCQY